MSEINPTPDLIRALPKVDLHRHLDGSLRPTTILELAKQQGLDLGVNNEEDLKKLVVKDNPLDLNDYLSAFSITCSVLQTLDSLERAAYEAAMDAASEGVIYMELRYAPWLHAGGKMEPIDTVLAVDRGLSRAEAEADIIVSLILCSMRNYLPQGSEYYQTLDHLLEYAPTDKEKNKRLAKLVAEQTAYLVVHAAKTRNISRVRGFDLAGSESDHPARWFAEAFRVVRQHNLFTTVHAGEDWGADSIDQAVKDCHANRIGHGVRILEDPELIEYMASLPRLCLEMCITSNLQIIKTIDSIDEHPFPYLLREYLMRVTLNTDNPLVSNTDMNHELITATEAFGLSLKEIARITMNAAKACFLPSALRRDLIRRISNYYKSNFLISL
jgi:adenosine deaminase